MLALVWLATGRGDIEAMSLLASAALPTTLALAAISHPVVEKPFLNQRRYWFRLP
jgi:peptidoglycan/LPS O-acetylase OafA/YrhL